MKMPAIVANKYENTSNKQHENTNNRQHENLSANKYENAFLYLLAEKFSCSAVFSKKEFAIWDLLARQISC